MRLFSTSRLNAVLAAACLAATTVTVTARVAHAQQQVSDADRKAARDLFFQGVDLQNAGKFGEALDKFQRAQGVVNAPTNLLHIAECQAALGKMVEAAETYRSIARYPMPANAPQAFVAAQSQAAGELAQLEPRIPEVIVDVQPTNVPTLQVSIDDQPIPSSLIGVGRPVNPGQHKVVAQAAGYTREEKTIDVKEKSKQKVTLQLQSNGAVTYAPAGTPVGAPLVAQPAGQPQQGEPPKPDKPQPYQGENKSNEPEYRSRMSLMIGPRLGLMVPAGNVPFSTGSTGKIADYTGGGGGIGLEASFRFVRVLYVGGILQGESYGNGTLAAQNGAERSSSGGLAALNFGWISNPDGFGVIFNGGVGYRWYTLQDKVTTLGSASATTVEESSSGTHYLLGFGLHIKAGKILRLVPKVEVDFGTLTADKAAAQGAAKGGAAFVFFGLAGHFDINLDKGPPKQTTASRF